MCDEHVKGWWKWRWKYSERVSKEETETKTETGTEAESYMPKSTKTLTTTATTTTTELIAKRMWCKMWHIANAIRPKMPKRIKRHACICMCGFSQLFIENQALSLSLIYSFLHSPCIFVCWQIMVGNELTNSIAYTMLAMCHCGKM